MLKLLADLIRVVNRAAPAHGEAPTSFKALSRFGISKFMFWIKSLAFQAENMWESMQA
jgi:hypothetical protein